MKSNFRQFLQQIVDMPYRRNAQSVDSYGKYNKLEQIVEFLLVKNGFKLVDRTDPLHQGHFQRDPNGSMASPDFLVSLDGDVLRVSLECKSMKTGVSPMYNASIPSGDTIYILSSGKYNKTIVYYGKHIVSDKKIELYHSLRDEVNALIETYRKKEGWLDDRGMDVRYRPYYEHKRLDRDDAHLDYFTHPDWEKNQNEVLKDFDMSTDEINALLDQLYEGGINRNPITGSPE